MIRSRWLLSIAGLSITLSFLFPIYWMLISSVKTSNELFGIDQTLFPKHITWDAYIHIFSGDYSFVSYIANSFIISVGSLVGTLVLATPASYGLARKRIKGSVAFLLTILIVQMFPVNMLALPLYSMFAKLHLTNTYLGIIIANITISLPFVILVLRTFFLVIPKELEDSAAIDGCSRWGAFFRIILPLARSGLLTCATFSFLFAWGEFLYSLTLLNKKELWTITLGMREFIGQYGSSWGELMAIATVSAFPIIVIFIFTQKYIISGVTAGAVKE